METVICQAENRFSFDELPLDFALSRYEEFDNECWLEIMQMIKKLSKVINAKIPILYKKLMLNKNSGISESFPHSFY